jgi:hypothetical protein
VLDLEEEAVDEVIKVTIKDWRGCFQLFRVGAPESSFRKLDALCDVLADSID